ncbi:nucleoside diphosphate kinase 6 isoform X2 [Phascolarctos cinereus]
MATLGRGGPSLLQLTLALIKPDAVAHPLILEAIHQQILSSQLLIVRTRDLVWRREDCQRFYQEHAVAQSGPTYWLTRTLSSSGGPSWGQPGCSELATWPPTLSVEALASRTHAIPPMAQTRWSLPAERSRPSSLTSASAAAAGEKKMMSAQAHCLSDVLFLDGFCFQYIEDSLRYKKASKLLEPEKWLPSQMTPNCK